MTNENLNLAVKEMLANPNRMVPEEVAAHFLGMSLVTLKRMRYNGNGPAWHDFGKRLKRYFGQDVIDFADQMRIEKQA